MGGAINALGFKRRELLLIHKGGDWNSDLESLGRDLFPEMLLLRLEIKAIIGEFLGVPVVRTPCFHC